VDWALLGTLVAAGLAAGVLAGLLGIGGGTVLVPILVTLGYAPIQAVGHQQSGHYHHLCVRQLPQLGAWGI
jgi:uncharacterized membrane protein YfcA